MCLAAQSSLYLQEVLDSSWGGGEGAGGGLWELGGVILSQIACYTRQA